MFILVLMELIQQSASNCYLCSLIDTLKWWKLMQREMWRFMILVSRAGCFFFSRNTKEGDLDIHRGGTMRKLRWCSAPSEERYLPSTGEPTADLAKGKRLMFCSLNISLDSLFPCLAKSMVAPDQFSHCIELL
jgi:hypothetical protein